jgi:hypothetical protein
MTKDNIFKTIKWVTIAIIVILLLRECRGIVNTYININKPNTDTVVEISHTSDTIWTKDTIYKIVPKKVFIPVVDTFWKPLPIDTNDFFRVFVSRDTFKTKELDLFTETHYQGLLRQIKPSYKLKVPIRIVDSVKVTTTVTNTVTTPCVFQVHVGVLVSSQLLAPEVGVSYKRHTFKVGYNLQNKFPTLGYSYTIFRK